MTKAAAAPAQKPAMRRAIMNSSMTESAPNTAAGKRSQNCGVPSPTSGESSRKKLGI